MDELINRGSMMNVLYVIYVVINIFIEMVVLNLPLTQTSVMILLLFIMLVEVKWGMQNKKRVMRIHLWNIHTCWTKLIQKSPKKHLNAWKTEKNHEIA